jgi:hypothetical protein
MKAGSCASVRQKHRAGISGDTRSYRSSQTLRWRRQSGANSSLSAPPPPAELTAQAVLPNPEPVTISILGTAHKFASDICTQIGTDGTCAGITGDVMAEVLPLLIDPIPAELPVQFDDILAAGLTTILPTMYG